MSDRMRRRIGLWLLRDYRLRIDASCPHGTFVPGRRRLTGPSGWWSCDDCGFKFHVAALDGSGE